MVKRSLMHWLGTLIYPNHVIAPERSCRHATTVEHSLLRRINTKCVQFVLVFFLMFHGAFRPIGSTVSTSLRSASITARYVCKRHSWESFHRASGFPLPWIRTDHPWKCNRSCVRLNGSNRSEWFRILPNTSHNSEECRGLQPPSRSSRLSSRHFLFHRYLFPMISILGTQAASNRGSVGDASQSKFSNRFRDRRSS